MWWFLCLNFAGRLMVQEIPRSIFQQCMEVFCWKLLDCFSTILLQLIIYVSAIYSIVSHLEFYFNIQLAAHRLSRTGFVLILVVFSFGCISVPYLQYGVWFPRLELFYCPSPLRRATGVNSWTTGNQQCRGTGTSSVCSTRRRHACCSQLPLSSWSEWNWQNACACACAARAANVQRPRGD